jgi:hypothetical protein
MGKQKTSKKGITPPKGRPTRGRDDWGGEPRVFGPVAQWIAVAIALIVVFVIIVVVTGGGDFNPFDQSGS